jgi:hypothetical protein
MNADIGTSRLRAGHSWANSRYVRRPRRIASASAMPAPMTSPISSSNISQLPEGAVTTPSSVMASPATTSRIRGLPGFGQCSLARRSIGRMVESRNAAPTFLSVSSLAAGLWPSAYVAYA